MYYSVGYIMDILEEKFNFKEQEFLNDLVNCLEYMERKIDGTIEWNVLENDVKIAVENNYDLKAIEFDYYGCTSWFEELNNNIKDDKYTIKNKEAKNYNNLKQLLKDKEEIKRIKKDVYNSIKVLYNGIYKENVLFVVYELFREIKKRINENIYFNSFDNFGKILELKKEIFGKEIRIDDKFFYDYDIMCLLIDILEKDFLNKLLKEEEKIRKIDAIMLFGFKLENVLNIAISLL